MLDLLTIGDCTVDLFLKVSEKDGILENDQNGNPEICFLHGNKIPVHKFQTSVAGNALNVALGCSKLGLNTGIYTEIGDDENSKKIEDALKENKVDTKFVFKNKNTPSNVSAVIVYGDDRTIFSYHEKRKYSVKNWGNPKWIYYTSIGTNFSEFQQELVNYIKQKNEPCLIFNPGTLHIKAGLENLKNILAVTDILIVNKEEAELFVGHADLEASHKELQKLGPKLTVITNGKDGASGYDGIKFTKVPAYINNQPVVDKTGAGDAFSAGFVSAIFYNKNLQEALQWGAINSAAEIKEIGANKGVLNKNELLEKIK